MTKRDEAPARDRVLRAALTEFAARGYEAASTNAIAARAGVAKGLVFHHFESKEQLFLAAHDLALSEVREVLLAGGEPLPPDLFERLHAWHLRKVALMRKRPELFDVLVIALAEAPASLQRELRRTQTALLNDAWPRVLDGVDASRLRPGVSLSDAVETLALLSDGLEKQVIALLRQGTSLEEVSRRSWTHFERLRDGLAIRRREAHSQANKKS
jgi:AcrR family transcriptional regulator